MPSRKAVSRLEGAALPLFPSSDYVVEVSTGTSRLQALMQQCAGCGVVWDQDVNAALNIRASGLVTEAVTVAKGTSSAPN